MAGWRDDHESSAPITLKADEDTSTDPVRHSLFYALSLLSFIVILGFEGAMLHFWLTRGLAPFDELAGVFLITAIALLLWGAASLFLRAALMPDATRGTEGDA